MIRSCNDDDFAQIYTIINAATQAYKGVIPADRWHEPYMPEEELRREIQAGVTFLGFEAEGNLVGVMGLQAIQDVTLIRHAYVLPSWQGRGIGGALLAALRSRTTTPVLIGTWTAAIWAIRFYEKHDFRLVTSAEKERLLRRYWSIPARQVETSVVLADRRWFELNQPLDSGRE
jgi:GNAT superfamily N-acetyltransferase